MAQKKVQIEQTLEKMGDYSDTPIDTRHYYELRRSLLCSKYFEPSRKKMWWNGVFTYAAPLVAGGIVVGTFTLLAVSLSSNEAVILNTVESNTNLTSHVGEAVLTSSVSVESSIPVSVFVSDPNEPLVQFADFVESQTTESIRFVPVHPHGVALVR